jgi:hypothetical protein
VAPKRKVRIRERMPANKAALYLELVAAGLRKGGAYLDPEDLSARFDLPSVLDFDLRVRTRRNQTHGNLRLELSWLRKDAPEADSVG